MLEEAAHDGADVHVLRLAGDARQQAGYAADDHLDADARAARLGDLVDHLAVGERVELEEDAGGLARAGALCSLKLPVPRGVMRSMAMPVL